MMQAPGVGLGQGPDAKFLHYCYVCNTQLNSCKQAMLHCSGKRHRKKLFFLQTRKHAFGGMSASQGFANMVPTGGDVHSHYGPAGPQSANPPGAPLPPVFLPPPPPAGPAMYPYPPMPTMTMSPATLAGTDTWLHAGGGHYYQPPHYQQTHHSLVLNLHNDSHPTVDSSSTPDSSNPLSPASSSPILSSEGARSAVMSPSDASSLSSGVSSGGARTFRCLVCGRHYATYEKLHVHLQIARHFKHFYANYSMQHQQHYTNGLRPAGVKTTPVATEGNGDANQTVNSRSSSSTSSDPIGDTVVDSGYLSEGSDEIVCILSGDGQGTQAKFRCQLCRIDLQSADIAQQHATSTRHIMEVTRKCTRRKSHSIKDSFVPEENNNTSVELSQTMEKLVVE